MKRWIEKLMDSERAASKNMLLAVGIALSFVGLTMAFLALTPFIDGVYTLDSVEKVDRFSRGSYMDGVLIYRAATPALTEIVITSTRENSISVSAGGVGEIPLPASSEETTYLVYRLAGEGFSVIYLTPDPLMDTGSVHVQAINHELNQDIIRDISPNGSNIYVLYDAGSPVPHLTLTALLLLAGITLLWLSGADFLRRRTALGRRISEMGDYRAVCREINRQAANPRFSTPVVVVLDDWVVFRSYAAYNNKPTWASVVSVRDLEGVEVVPDADDPEMVACSIRIKGWHKPHTFHLDTLKAGDLREALRSFSAL